MPPAVPPPSEPTAATRPATPWQRRWIRYPVLAVAAWLLLCGLLALGLPLGLDRLVLPKVSEQLGRTLTAERIRFNPFTLRLTANGLRLGGPAGNGETATIDALDVDLSIRSLRHLAPVIESLRIVAPSVTVAREADGRYDFADIVARLDGGPSPEPSKDGPARFALHNIELLDGRIRIDDRLLGQQHEIHALQIGLPFLSTLPNDIETFVQPALSAVVNDSALKLTGRTLPFHDSRSTELTVDLADVEIGRYLKLSPVPLAFTVPQGRLTTDLRVTFLHAADGNRLTIAGQTRLDDLAIDGAGGRLLSARRIAAELTALEPLAGRFQVGPVAIDGLDVAIAREADGRLPIVAAFTPHPATLRPATPHPAMPGKDNGQGKDTAGDKPPAPPAGSPADPQTVWSVERTTVRDGRVLWTDRTTSPAVALEQKAIALELGAIGNRQSAAAPVTLTLSQVPGGRLDWSGGLDLARARASGRVEATVAAVAPYLPYFADALAARVATGPISAAARFEAGWTDRFTLTLADGAAAVESLQLTLPDERTPAVAIGRTAIDGLALDLAARQVTIAGGQLAKADVRVLRDAKGGINLARIVAAPKAMPKAAAKAPGTAAGTAVAAKPATGSEHAADAPGWTVTVARLALDDNRVEWQDRSPPSPVTVPVSGLSGTIENVGSRLDARSNANLRATVGRRGRLTANGGFVVTPLSLDLKLQLEALALATVDPYLAERLAVGVKEGTLSGAGRLRLDPARARFDGQVSVDGLSAAERRDDAELLRWKSLALTGLDVDLATAASGASDAGNRVGIGQVTLDEFFARVELGADGRFNLQNLVTPAPADNGSAAARTDHPAASPPTRIRIGGIRLAGGASNFTDHFVKPNYSVDLSDLNGSVSAMATDSSEPADVLLEGRIDGDAPIRIDGKLNPLGPTLYTDIAASAKGIDLPTFTPYSGKYAGYAIEKGKMSLDVRYRIENEKLEASNRLFLDQLTFGEKVDSPDAIDLPIQFAIGLLKNGRGEIDVNLPIGGSLDDPQFSIGGLVWQAVKNLLTKIVTAPFSALAAAFGGGEELSWVEFRPGTAELAGSSQKRLETIAKALADRPALKLEIAGRMDPKAEAQAFGRARLEERLRALRGEARRGGRGSGNGTGKTGTATEAVPAEERPALIKRLAESLPAASPDAAKTSDAATAPGAAKVPDQASSAATPPTTRKEDDPAAVEARVAAALAADPEAQRTLAIRRSQVARDWLTGQGKIAGERIFQLAPRVGNAARPDGQKPECTAACAEFSLR